MYFLERTIFRAVGQNLYQKFTKFLSKHYQKIVLSKINKLREIEEPMKAFASAYFGNEW